MLAAVIGGIPGAGATKGTVVNINAGGRTRLSGALHGIFLLTVLLGLGTLAAHIPLAVLAGLLIPVGFKIIDFKGLKHLKKVPKADAFVLVIVLLITTFGSLINAVGIGVALAALLFMIKAGDMAKNGLDVGPVADFDGEKPWQDELEFYDTYKDKVIIKHLYGPLFFGFTSYFKDGIKNLDDDIKALIIRMDRVPYMDQSGVYALEEAVFDLRAQDVEVILTGLKEQPKAQMEAIDLIDDLIPHEDIFDTVGEAFLYLRQKLN
jgi:SulP family sulfate permease